MKMDKFFDARKYWDERLRKYSSLEGVGCVGLGERFNYWLYKSKVRTVRRMMRKYKLSFKGLRILDVGCGIGFWIEYYLKQGAKEIVGIDISNVAIEFCRKKFQGYSNVKLWCNDLGTPLSSEWLGKFDIVNCFDVVYHVVDDRKFTMFMENICKALKPGGYILINDLFVDYRGAPHVRFRNLNFYKLIFRKNNVQILDLMPMYFVLSPILRGGNKPIGHLLASSIYGIIFLSKNIRPIGSFVYPAIYAIDSLFTLIPQIKLSSILMVGIRC
jgi:2-polyprenyl-3-methyl-5-hydroxy-6-metoxy-1,4-benzoquinol methylase